MSAIILWAWDADAEVYRKVLVDNDGKLLISDADPFEVVQDTPEDLKHVPHGYHEAGAVYKPFAVDADGVLQISAAITGGLNDLDDVTIADVADGEFISWSDGLGYWQNRALAEGDIPAEIARDTEVTDAIDTLAAKALPAAIEFVIDGGGEVITTGLKMGLEIPFACTISIATLIGVLPADTNGSIVIDVWKTTYAAAPPEDANSITAAAPPTITNAKKSQDSTLTGWTTAIAAGDILFINVDSCTTFTAVTLSLKITKT